MRLFIGFIILNFSFLSGQTVFDEKNEIGGVYYIINFFAKTINDFGYKDYLHKLRQETQMLSVDEARDKVIELQIQLQSLQN